MGIFSKKHKVVYEGATDEERSVANQIAGTLSSPMYKGKQREFYLQMKFDDNVKESITPEGNKMYRVFGNKCHCKENLYKNYKKSTEAVDNSDRVLILNRLRTACKSIDRLATA